MSIPNDNSPWGRVNAVAIAHSLAITKPVAVPFAEKWRVTHDPFVDRLAVVGSGSVREVPFGTERQLAALDYLRRADWLDEVLRVMRGGSGGDPSPLLARLPDLLGELGALTLATHVERPRFWLGPGGVAVGPDGRPAGPEAVLYANQASPTQTEWSLAVDPFAALRDLAELRRGLAFALALQGPAREGAVAEMLDVNGPFRRLEDVLINLPEEDAVRLYFSAHLRLDVRVTLGLPDGAGPMRFIPAPLSGAQQLWIVLGATAGVLDVGERTDRVHSCDYMPCGRLFVGDRSHARGTHRFCSTECGKRFWATQSTRRKRAANKSDQAKEN